MQAPRNPGLLDFLVKGEAKVHKGQQTNLQPQWAVAAGLGFSRGNEYLLCHCNLNHPETKIPLGRKGLHPPEEPQVSHLFCVIPHLTKLEHTPDPHQRHQGLRHQG